FITGSQDEVQVIRIVGSIPEESQDPNPLAVAQLGSGAQGGDSAERATIVQSREDPQLARLAVRRPPGRRPLETQEGIGQGGIAQKRVPGGRESLQFGFFPNLNHPHTVILAGSSTTWRCHNSNARKVQSVSP